jgi:hypothetical protein
METDILFGEFATVAMLDTEAQHEVSDFDCLRLMMESFEAFNHGRMSDYQLKYVSYFVNACQTLVHPDLALHALKKVMNE